MHPVGVLGLEAREAEVGEHDSHELENGADFDVDIIREHEEARVVPTERPHLSEAVPSSRGLPAPEAERYARPEVVPAAAQSPSAPACR